MGRGPRPGVGGGSRAGAARARGRRGRRRGGRRRRGRHRAHPRPPGPRRGRRSRCATASAARPWPPCAIRPTCASRTATRSGRSPCCTCPATRRTTPCWWRARRASPATRCWARAACSSPRTAAGSPPTSTACAGCARSGSRACIPATGRSSRTRRRRLDGYVAHRLERERRLVAALAAGARTEAALLDAAWSDAPAALRPAAALTLRAHLAKLRDEGRAPADLPPG